MHWLTEFKTYAYTFGDLLNVILSDYQGIWSTTIPVNNAAVLHVATGCQGSLTAEARLLAAPWGVLASARGVTASLGSLGDICFT